MLNTPVLVRSPKLSQKAEKRCPTVLWADSKTWQNRYNRFACCANSRIGLGFTAKTNLLDKPAQAFSDLLCQANHLCLGSAPRMLAFCKVFKVPTVGAPSGVVLENYIRNHFLLFFSEEIKIVGETEHRWRCVTSPGEIDLIDWVSQSQSRFGWCLVAGI